MAWARLHPLQLGLTAPSNRPKTFGLDLAPGGGLLLRQDRVRISLCMIARDSAATLRPCLESIRPWVDEMVIVDTGSSDDTPRIVEELGGRLFHFPWCDDFAAARNESLRHARGDWLFWMDSDDTIPAECGRQLRVLVDREVEPGLLGYVVQVHCPGAGDDGDPANDVTVVDHVKLIRNRPDLRFEGRIHEQILPAIRRAGGSVAWTDLYVVHSGSDPSAEAQDRKRRRDLHLLHMELRERPDHPFPLFNVGMTYSDAGQFEEAAEFLRRSIEHSKPRRVAPAQGLCAAGPCRAPAGTARKGTGDMPAGAGAFPTGYRTAVPRGRGSARARAAGGIGAGLPRRAGRARGAALHQH